ncbi:MAG: RagB/SusD family nutrient uptake outer membrane protein [Bacteroidetes bacterium]|nr:RagB/SusD family nutrient uptake outer membrane protein [Bacteroidota bacterium]
MIRFNKIITALSLVLVLQSCTKQLDLENPQAVGNGLAFSNETNIKQILLGAYDAMSSGSLYGGDIQIFGDLMAASGELNWAGTFNTYREVFGNNTLTTNPIILGQWAAGYRAINVSNNVIAQVDKVAAADRGKVKGEALFIRGTMLFELTRFFAKAYTDGNPAQNPGVVIRTKPTEGYTSVDYPSRNTVAECYEQVIKDLTEAANLLPEENDVFANKAAAYTILARVYLQMAKFPEARDAANQGLIAAAAGNFELVADYQDAFNQEATTSEDLLAIVVTDQDGVNNCHTFYSVPDFGGRDGDIVILKKHLDLYDPADARKALFYNFDGLARSGKWKNIYKNVKVIRLAELYLIRAEANFRAGTEVGDKPVNDINVIRARAGLPDLAIVTLDDILLERRLELAHEGFRIHDAKRLNEVVNGKPANDDKLVFPIPFRELNTNPNLVQNSGY